MVFISQSLYKNNIISCIQENLDYFVDEVYEKQFLNFLLKNKINVNNPKRILLKSLSFMDYIDLIHMDIELFKNIDVEIDEQNFKLQIMEQWE